MIRSERAILLRKFILQNVEKYPGTIAQVACVELGTRRQVVDKSLQNLVDEGLLSVQGKGGNRFYELELLVEWEEEFELCSGLAEDVIWSQYVEPCLQGMSISAADIWNHGFTEMFNNAIDHSEGQRVEVYFSMSATHTEISLHDDGIGIFKKIQESLNLVDERQAALELAKGKFTTAPDRHSGEGIFFTSRMFDDFEISSNGIYFMHTCDDEDKWLLDEDRIFAGTTVRIKLTNETSRLIETVFNQFSSGDDHGFTKTVVPVKLAQYGDGRLVSRSQAKRLLVRCNRFEMVVLDFKDVRSIGQAFADQIFRVFSNQYPEVSLDAINASVPVVSMIKRAQKHK